MRMSAVGYGQAAAVVKYRKIKLKFHTVNNICQARRTVPRGEREEYEEEEGHEGVDRDERRKEADRTDRVHPAVGEVHRAEHPTVAVDGPDASPNHFVVGAEVVDEARGEGCEALAPSRVEPQRPGLLARSGSGGSSAGLLGVVVGE